MTLRGTIAVVGTDTGCGKTAVTAALAAAIRARGVRVRALKPVATGVEPGAAGEDATLLAMATGAPASGCALRTFRAPRSPLAAARLEGAEVDAEELATAIEAWETASDGDEVRLVEGVGGVLVPLSPMATVRDLLRRLDLPVVIAARAGIGTVNHSALTVEACRAGGLRVLGIVLVDVDGNVDPGVAAENAAQVAAQTDAPVLGVLPHVDAPDDPAVLGPALDAAVDVDALLGAVAGDGGALQHEVTVLDHRHVWHPFTQMSEWTDEEPLVVVSGHGRHLRCADGRTYLDGIGALWANLHGYGHPRLDAALREQAGRVSHATFLGQTHEGGARLAAELAAMAPPGLDRVFFSESGASAVEVALRVALLAHLRRGDRGRTRFVSLEEAYHGDTAGAVSVGRSEPFHRGLDPLLVDVLRVPPPQLVRVRDGVGAAEAERRSLTAVADLLSQRGHEVAAVVVEPRVQGAAGIWPHSDTWLAAVARLTRAAGALLVCDEVATGFGRTGDLLASTGAGVVPDLVTLGKALSGGYLPISATLCSNALFDLFTAPYPEHRALYYGHTFTANPLAVAVARASLAVLVEEDVVARGRALGARLGAHLEAVAALPLVAEVRRRGVMVGIELTEGGRLGTPHAPELRIGRRVALAARRRGVVVRPLGDVVVLNPALTMTDAEATALVDAVGEAIVEVDATAPAAAGRR